MLETGNAAVFALRFMDDEEVVIAFHNLSEQEQSVDASSYVDLDDQRLVLSDSDYSKPLAEDPANLIISRFGYLWLRGRYPGTALPG